MTQRLFLPALLVGCIDAPKRESASTAQAGPSAAAAKQYAASPVNAPRVIQTDSGPIAILTEPMAAALRRNNPHFRLWPWTVYPDSVRASFHASDAEGLRVVVGDFNGDGRPDVALDGTDTVVFRVGGKREATMIAVLTSGDSPIIVSVIETDLPHDTTRLDRWLRLVPAKSFRPALRTDALGLLTLAEPGANGLRPYQVFWWQPVRKRFVQWVDGE